MIVVKKLINRISIIKISMNLRYTFFDLDNTHKIIK